MARPRLKTNSVRFLGWEYGAECRVRQCGLYVTCISNTAFVPTWQQRDHVPLSHILLLKVAFIKAYSQIKIGSPAKHFLHQRPPRPPSPALQLKLDIVEFGFDFL